MYLKNVFLLKSRLLTKSTNFIQVIPNYERNLLFTPTSNKMWLSFRSSYLIKYNSSIHISKSSFLAYKQVGETKNIENLGKQKQEIIVIKHNGYGNFNI